MSRFAKKIERIAPFTQVEWSSAKAKQNLGAVHTRLRLLQQSKRRRQRRLLVAAAAVIGVVALCWGANAFLQRKSILPNQVKAQVVESVRQHGVAHSPQISTPVSDTAQSSLRNDTPSLIGHARGNGSVRVAPETALSSPEIADTVSENGAPLRFEDGSSATPLQSATRMVVKSVSDAQVVLALQHGRARFDVTPNAKRRFQVDVGFVDVVVLGTSFTVNRSLEDVSVTVHRGVVRAQWTGGSREIRPGQGQVLFSRASGHSPVVVLPQVPQKLQTPMISYDGEDSPLRKGRDERIPRTSGNRSDAVTVPGTMTMADVLRAADAQRLKGHSIAAAKLLQDGLLRFPNSPQAATASFTLGRVLLEECQLPKEAALAFFNARSKRPFGALAEDALAREVEAWQKAGDKQQAKRLAIKYLELYPKGARIKSVRRFGSIE
ncbi:MAG: FecR domain-containing protein [Deltaproteobacteria bacterium]|nr:FecR domain-containing protein [Deltaproteobacteria bacterium]